MKQNVTTLCKSKHICYVSFLAQTKIFQLTTTQLALGLTYWLNFQS